MPEKRKAVSPNLYTCKITNRMCVAASTDRIDPELIGKFPPRYDNAQAQRCPCYDMCDSAAKEVISWLKSVQKSEAEFVASVFRTY
jgi:hypothetical protein